MAVDRIVGESTEVIEVTECCGVLERADPEVRCRHPNKNRSWQGLLSHREFTGGDDSEGSSGGNPEGGHRFADEVLAQHRPQGRLAITPTGEGGAS